MPFKKNNPGCPCCLCPSNCALPAPVYTGSTSAGSVWYLHTSDPYGDKSSYMYLFLSSLFSGGAPLTNFEAAYPGHAWAQQRLYFGYKDASNCFYLQIWGYAAGATVTYVYAELHEVVSGTDTTIASRTMNGTGASANWQAYVTITYNGVTGNGFILIDPSFANPDQGIAFSASNPSAMGWQQGIGYGSINNGYSPSTTLDLSTLTDAWFRHVDYCYTMPNGMCLRTQQIESVTLTVSGATASGCSSPSALNGSFTLTRPTTITPLLLLSPEIVIGCTFPGGGNAYNWKYGLFFGTNTLTGTGGGDSGYGAWLYGMYYVPLFGTASIDWFEKAAPPDSDCDAPDNAPAGPQVDCADLIDGLVYSSMQQRPSSLVVVDLSSATLTLSDPVLHWA